ncbi:MAG: hypothetical protein K0S26_43, partial [Bacteroidota bacterium]|nr:hypothetical protein [Bacteroidota bacterium]
QSNKLATIPSLPNSLKILYCSSNSLTAIPSLPSNLFLLDCENNQITGLPALPNSLAMLRFSNNLVTNIPILPAQLTDLTFSNNLVDSLPELPSSLFRLMFDNNNVSHIDLFPNGLNNLSCANNQLTQLPSLPPFLETFGCSYNNISCMPSIPNSIISLAILNNPITCLPNYIQYMDAATLAYPLCAQSNTLTNPNNCNVFQGIEGSTYNDANLNCIKTTDQYATNVQMKLYDNSNIYLGCTNSFGSGIFNFALSPGSYKVVVDTLYRPYSVICSNPGIDSSAILTSTVTNINNINFAVNCKPGFDIGVQSIITNGLIFPGQTHTLTVMAGDMYKWFHMNCSFGISGIVSFSVNGPATYLSPAPGALTPSIIGNLYTYSITDFGAINNAAAFGLIFSVDTTANVNDQICVTATITPTNGDNNPTNNMVTYCYNVVNSLDPNIKEVYPVDVMPAYNDWLIYTIHFQNTGNAPAINIRLADTLDNMLDLETFQVINFSHYNQTHLTGNILNVNFPNIQLADSSTNPIGSVGFIQYRAKPKMSWVAPYKIKNTAYIYFDFNSPIFTNTTYNSIVVDLGIKELSEKSVLIYPNPTNGTFTIELNSKEKQFVQILDITGNCVLSQSIGNGNGAIDAGHLAAGIYNVQIKGEATVTNKKLVIVK